MRDHHKTRSGCVNCKQRRIKCDESKPDCLRCEKIGRKCYYQPPKTWIFEPKYHNSSARSSSTDTHSSDDSNLGPALLKSVTTSTGETDDERRSFHFYLLGMGVLESSNDTDFDIMLKYIPQLSHEIPALRSAIFCISNFVQGLISDSERSREHTEAAHVSYIQTIRSLVAPQEKSRLRPEEVLLACVMLRSIESFRHDYARAAVHLKGAVHILAENEYFRHSSIVNPKLKSLIYRLAMKAVMATGEISAMSQSRQLGLSIDPDNAMDQLYQHVVLVCKTLAAAHEIGSPDSRRDPYSLTRACLEQLDGWQTQLRDAILQHPEYARLPNIAYALLQYQLARIVLLSLHEPVSRKYDNCTNSFRAALEFCHRFEEYSERQRHPVRLYIDDQRLRLNFATEFIPAVFFIAYECRDREVRCGAVDFLNQAYRRELGWETSYAAKVAQRIAELEERQCPATEIQSLLSPIFPNSDDCLSTTRRVKLLGIHLYRDIETGGDAFRRPEWAVMQYEQYGKRREEWLDLQNGPPRSPETRDSSGHFRFCHRLQEPFMPSAAAMMTLAWEQGIVGQKDTISAKLPDAEPMDCT